jgi:hypothetical protein
MSIWVVLVLAAVGLGAFLLFLTWQSKRLDRRPWWRRKSSARTDDPGGPPLGPDDRPA